MKRLPVVQWDSEKLFTSGDEYLAGLLAAVRRAQLSIEFESYIFERGVAADRLVKAFCEAAQRGVRVRMIIDGWGSYGFASQYWPALKAAGVKARFFRAIPSLFERLPGDPESFFYRLYLRLRQINRGNHRKFCLIDQEELWVGSFNVSDVHLREVSGDQAWKDLGVCVRGSELRYAHRAFHRTFRGWSALNWPARSPNLLLLNDSFLHNRRTRIEHVQRLKKARERIWLATPYFVPTGNIYRQLVKQARKGVDVRVIVPRKNDVWLVRWISMPLLKSLSKHGVKIFIFTPRFAHHKLFIADDWICLGSTNLNHRSFLHDLEMDVVITHPENKQKLIDSYLEDISLSQPFELSPWAHLPWWGRLLSSLFSLMKYWV